MGLLPLELRDSGHDFAQDADEHVEDGDGREEYEESEHVEHDSIDRAPIRADDLR